MNTKHSILNMFNRCILAAVGTLGLTACDSVIYDNEGDCTLTYKVQFLDDYNLLYADAFEAEVENVTLYALDKEGHVVWQGEANKKTLRKNNNTMELPLQPGEYELIAWANGNVPNAALWQAPADHDLWRQLRLTQPGLMTADANNVFHGHITATLPDNEDASNKYNREFVYPMHLVKNTNGLRIVVQQTKGNPHDPSEYDYALTADNTLNNELNDVVPQGITTYKPWSTRFYDADMQPEDAALAPATRAGERYTAAVVEFTTGRLMNADAKDVRVTVTHKPTGNTVLSFPLVDYLLMVKSAHFSGMDPQEYLDRQNDCSIVFFLSEDGNRMIAATINVLSWRVVLQSSGL